MNVTDIHLSVCLLHNGPEENGIFTIESMANHNYPFLTLLVIQEAFWEAI